jgi:protein-S-isoprenylcysteine O-methyltransferase Ste14
MWRVTGVALVMSGLALLLAGGIGLGPGLTPLPYPKDGARLVESGPFALVRHPMYSGGVFIAFGWAVYACSWLTVAYAFVLFAFLDAKSRREERWLEEKFPGYRDYKRRVARFIPFVY